MAINFWQLSSEFTFKHLSRKWLVQAANKAFPEMKGLNILNNNRELAYQSVFHSHIHLVPRYSKEDDFSIHFVNHQDSYGSEELKAIQETIVKQVSCDD